MGNRKDSIMKKMRIASLLTACVLLLGVMAGCTGNGSVTTGGQPQESQAQEVSSIPEEPVKEPTTVRMMAAGDNLIHSSIYKQAKARGTDGGYDFSYAYQNIADIIARADLPVINQETVIAPIYEPSDYPCFNSPPELGDEMLKLGFRVFNHANNHILDKGTKGVISTLDYWAGKEGALVTGAYRNDEDLNTVKTMTVNDITFSFIGITEHTNGIPLPDDTDIRLIYTSDEELIKQQIEAAKEQSDCVVVSAHWGVEGTHTIADRQKDLAQKMVDWGADIILGTHPHVLQSIEMLQKPDGTQAPVIYSLGNFISAQSEAPNMIGGILDLTVTKNFEDNSISVSDVKLIPTITQYESGYSNIRIIPWASYTEELANQHGVRRNDSRFTYDYVEETLNTVIGEEYLEIIK